MKTCPSCSAVSLKSDATFCAKCGAGFILSELEIEGSQRSSLLTPAALGRSAIEGASKALGVDNKRGFCIACGLQLTQANKKDDSKMCYKCYMQKLQLQQAQGANQLLMRANGINGQVELFPTKIRIAREGLLQTRWRYKWGDKEILLSQISAIQFKKAGLYQGYIRFSFSGADQMSGIRDIFKDENAVAFGWPQQQDFERIKAAIERRIAELRHSPERPEKTFRPDYTEQIQKLAELRAQGIVTEEEFQTKKRELLARM